jgi:SAM-dependent methyltransferase
VTRSDVLHLVAGNREATIVADLTRADAIPTDTFDCIICVQTLQMIFEVRPAIRHLWRILKPGGVLLATAHGTSKIGRRLGVDHWGEYWRFTTQSAERLLQEVFPASRVQVEARGNVLAAIAFLHGLAAEELEPLELDYCDPDYEVLSTMRAVKPNG